MKLTLILQAILMVLTMNTFAQEIEVTEVITLGRGNIAKGSLAGSNLTLKKKGDVDLSYNLSCRGNIFNKKLVLKVVEEGRTVTQAEAKASNCGHVLKSIYHKVFNKNQNVIIVLDSKENSKGFRKLTINYSISLTE